MNNVPIYIGATSQRFLSFLSYRFLSKRISKINIKMMKIRFPFFIFSPSNFFFLFVGVIDMWISFAQLFIFKNFQVFSIFNLTYFQFIWHFLTHFLNYQLAHFLILGASMQIYKLSKYLINKYLIRRNALLIPFKVFKLDSHVMISYC